MKEIISTITSKGQVTIPAEVRRHLGLKTKDKISFVLEPEGTVRLKSPRYPDIASLRGAAGSLKKPLSWEEMRQIAREDHLKNQYQNQPWAIPSSIPTSSSACSPKTILQSRRKQQPCLRR